MRALSRKNVWEALPDGVRAEAGRLLGVLPSGWLLGARFRRELAFVRDAEWWPAERARAYQLQRLQRLCAHAVRRSPFYREAFARAGADPRDLTSMDAVRRLPIIDRETIRTRAGDMHVRGIRWRGVDRVSTGGTGGVPLHFAIDASRSAVDYAYLCAGWRRVGFDLGTRLAVFRGRVVPPDAAGLRHQYDGILRHHYYSVFHLTDENIGRYLEHLRGIGACFVHTYPSAARALAQFMRRYGIDPPENVRGVLTESEILYPAQRQLIERAFGRPVLSSYGQTEKVAAAAGCEHSANYHVWPTYGLFELIDAAGRPVTEPGARGEIVGTSFINTVMPFIRYRTGDFATYVGDRCASCGREHPVIAHVRGHRTQESLVAHDGSRIPWTAVNVHDDTFLHVKQFQFVQHEPGRAVLNLVPAESYAAADAARILARLRAKLADRVAVTVALVDAIRLSPAGKAIYVDQRVADPDGREAGEDDSRPAEAVPAG